MRPPRLRRVQVLAHLGFDSLGLSLFSGEITIGDHVKIPVRTFTKVEAQKAMTLSKRSKAAPDGTDAKVKMDRQYRSTADPTLEIPKEDQVKSFKYGRDRVS